MTRGLTRHEELERLNRALKTLSGANRALLRATDEVALLQDICSVVVEDAGYLGATVVRPLPGAAGRFEPVVRIGSPEAFADLRAMAAAGADMSGGVAATAIETGEQCLVNDVQNSHFPQHWREFYARHGFGSGLSLPIRVDGAVYGALTILAPEADAFDEFERAPLCEAAADLAFGLETLRAKQRGAAAEEALRKLTYYDSTSGLPNRVHLRQLLADSLQACRRDGQPLALVRLELERFRDIAEALGDTAADETVRQVTERIRELLSPSHVLAHIGEAEFAIVCPGAAAESARQLAERLAAVEARPVEVDSIMLDVRWRMGISIFPGHGAEAELLVRRAGIALGYARRRGTAWALFTGGLDEQSRRQIALVADLRRAVGSDELVLYGQPKLRIAGRALCGFEALVRWNHPSLGLLNPGDFIQIAESTGLITPLTYWMLDAALRQGYAWRESGLVRQPMSVNLSAHDLQDPRLLDRVSGALETWGAPAGSIDFELTESALMEDPAGALETLERLKRLNVSLTIDDFGTGYSSLAYLRRLPVDAIKIDQSFVRAMTTDADSAMIVRSTIDLAHNLKLGVIAEGVEDQTTMDALAELGCDVAQGYAICRPLPVAELGVWAGAAGTAH
jgi:diguanylate cyclase (GGDEF)-like protein